MLERKNYTREFKIEAVRLLDQADRPSSEIAKQLGVKRTLLYRWRDALRAKGESAFKGSGRPVGDQENEVTRLRRELKRITEETENRRRSKCAPSSA